MSALEMVIAISFSANIRIASFKYSPPVAIRSLFLTQHCAKYTLSDTVETGSVKIALINRYTRWHWDFVRPD